MVMSNDGRRVGVRRNGLGFVSMSDDRRSAEFTIDHARALRLADALENGEPCQVPTNQGRVLCFSAPHLGDEMAEPDGASEVLGYRVRPQQRRGPWGFGEAERVWLAAEIREAVRS